MNWFSRLFCRARLNRELEEEIRVHLAMDTRARVERGEPAAVSRIGARRDFGNPLLIKEATRRVWGFSTLEVVVRDLRFALRQWKRGPGVAFIAILSLALGIGANTAMFSVVNAVLLRSLPVPTPGELYRVRIDSRIPVPQRYSYPQFQSLRDAASPAAVAAMSQIARMNVTTGANAQAERANVQLVSGEFFRTVEVGEEVGRVLTEADNRVLDGHPVAVLSHAFWRDRFGGSDGVIGHTIAINGIRFTIVGVAAQGFKGMFLETPTDVWIPMMMQSDVRYHEHFSSANGASDRPWVPQDQVAWVDILLRTAPQAEAQTLAAMNAEVHRRLAATAESIGDPQQRSMLLARRLVLQPFGQGQSRLRDRFTPLLLTLMGMVALVLIIACANTANLLLARATARQREIAVRLSLGAGRRRLIQQLLTESLLLVSIAAVAGLLLAHLTVNAIVATIVESLTGQSALLISLDSRVLVFTIAVAVVSGVLFGLAPAIRATRVDLDSMLKTAARAVQGFSGRRGFFAWAPAKVLISVQVALSLLLVMGAVLFSRNLYNLSHVNWGFDQSRVLSVSIDPVNSGLTVDQLPVFGPRLLDQVRAVRGVSSAALAECGLADGCQSSSNGIHISGYQPSPGEEVRFQENFVSASYLPTVGMTLVAGRNFDRGDRRDTPRVAIVNQALVRRYFAGRDPIGQRFGYETPDTQIIGVIADAHLNSAREPVAPMAYYPLEQNAVFPFSLEVRTTSAPEQVASAVRPAIAEAFPRLVVERITPLAVRVESAASPDRIVALLASGFGALALVLACIGLYGVTSYAVVRRTSEIGVRMALGARPGTILSGILCESLLLVCAGLAIGLPFAIWASKALASGLFGVGPAQLSSLTLAAFLLTSIASLAALFPAWRASRVNPVVALRQQ